MQERLNRILNELEHRYGMTPEFSAQVRPIAEKIFSSHTPEDLRPGLLTLLAETYERQAEIQENFQQAIQGIRKMFDDLAKMVQRAYGVEEKGLDQNQGEKKNNPPSDAS